MKWWEKQLDDEVEGWGGEGGGRKRKESKIRGGAEE